jgi:predicted alpha/beta hydrolase family esterase
MKPSVLIVPGLRDHVEEHWQTILARKIGAPIVPPLQQDKLWCAARVAALDGALRKLTGPVILVAHSAGAMIVAHWAQYHTGEIAGALLATPADLETPLPPGYPTEDEIRLNGWLPIPREKLPFPAIVAASTNDPLARFDRVAQYASDWGAQLVDIGAVGHLNPAAGFGEWPQAEALLAELSGP